MRRNRKKEQFHLDIAPVNLIDLLLVLLIFFITTTTFLQLKVIELNLPSSKSNDVKYKKNLTYVVNIKEDCSIFFDKESVDLTTLSNKITQKYNLNKESVFQIGADEETPHRCFVDILDVFKSSNIENISILTKQRK
jgi:biopolymer transport protein ExbD